MCAHCRRTHTHTHTRAALLVVLVAARCMAHQWAAWPPSCAWAGKCGWPPCSWSCPWPKRQTHILPYQPRVRHVCTHQHMHARAHTYMCTHVHVHPRTHEHRHIDPTSGTSNTHVNHDATANQPMAPAITSSGAPKKLVRRERQWVSTLKQVPSMECREAVEEAARVGWVETGNEKRR